MIVVNGASDFLFLNRNRLPKVAANYQNMIKELVVKYNKLHDEPLPPITPHILRHTIHSVQN